MFIVAANKYIRVRGKKISEFRARVGLSQEALAKAIGASKGGIYNIEREEVANVYLAKRRKLIDALGITDAVFEKEIVCHDPRPLSRSTTTATDRAKLPDDPTSRAVHVLRGLARSAADARIAVAMFLTHSETRAVRDAMAARLKKPDVAKDQPVDRLPLVMEGKANNP